jgi:DNA repair ATPase RecN
MNDQIRQSIREVQEAMAHVNQAFQDYVEELSALNKEPSEIRQIAKNADALKDSGHIYMSWARHYAGLGGDEASTEDIDEDEGRIVDF